MSWTIRTVLFHCTLIAVGVASGSVLRSEDTLPARSAASGVLPLTLKPGELDARYSRAYIFVDKTGFGHQHAVEGRIKAGSLRVGSEPAGKIVFDMTSFIADSAEARRYLGLQGQTDASTQRQVTANMLGAEVLDVGRFPAATFEVATLTRTRDKTASAPAQYELSGTFTLRGVSQKLKMTAEGTDERDGYLHLRGSFALRQTSFGIRPFQKAFGTIGVADVLQVYGDLWLVRNRSPAQ